MISHSRPKLSDIYTLSQTKLFENHTLNLSLSLSVSHSRSPASTHPSPAPPAFDLALNDLNQNTMEKNTLRQYQSLYLIRKSDFRMYFMNIFRSDIFLPVRLVICCLYHFRTGRFGVNLYNKRKPVGRRFIFSNKSYSAFQVLFLC